MQGLLHGIDLTLVAIITFIPLILLVYIYNDAENRYGSGCYWGLVVFLTSWVGIVLYFAMRTYYERRTTAKTLGEQFPIDTSHMGRFGRGIAGQSGEGSTKQTVFGKENPDAPEFRDYHAEELIESGKYEEARKYLVEMADMAKREGDSKRVTTYRYYYNKIKELSIESSEYTLTGV